MFDDQPDLIGHKLSDGLIGLIEGDGLHDLNGAPGLTGAGSGGGGLAPAGPLD